MAIQPAIDAVATAQATLTALGTLSEDAGTAQQALLAIQNAQGALLAARQAADVGLLAIEAGAAPGGLVSNAADLLAAVTQTGLVAVATQAQGYLGRAAVNLAGAPWV